MSRLTLKQRIHRFLQVRGGWVSSRDIAAAARKKGFEEEDIWDELDALSEDTQVGQVWNSGTEFFGEWKGVPRGKYYRWYDMTDEEVREHEERLQIFEELP